MGKKCIGVDVGGTTVKIGVFEDTGRLLRKWEIPTRKEEGGLHVLEDVAASIRQALLEEEISLSEVIGAGIGVPGPVKAGGYVEICVNLGWKDRDPARELSELLDGLPVQCGNDANVAALGEMWQGGGKGYRDIVAITLGTGVGGGIIIDEKIVAGRHGLAGEIGHIHIRDEEKERCNCGSTGCVEQVTSATGIAREARRAMAASGEASVLRTLGDQVTAKDVLDAAKAGDELAGRVMETVGSYLGRTLALLALTVDPEIFVIGGGVSKAGQYLIDLVEGYYRSYVTLSQDIPKLGLAQLGNDAGIYGAARMVLE